jgi:hypothetical protein
MIMINTHKLDLTIGRLLVVAGLVFSGGCLYPDNRITQGATNCGGTESIATDLGYKGARHTYLLALVKAVDDRPLYLDRALVALEYPWDQWRLVYACRNPKSKRDWDRKWHEFFMSDMHVIGSKYFRHRPSRKEVEGFLVASNWHYEAAEHFRMITSEVFTNEWRVVFKFDPVANPSGHNN